MSWLYGIGITIAILAVEYGLLFGIGLALFKSGASQVNINQISYVVAWIFTLAFSVWAALDSKSVELKKYKSGLPSIPAVLGICCALLFVIAFPWYLSVRFKIKNGTGRAQRRLVVKLQSH